MHLHRIFIVFFASSSTPLIITVTTHIGHLSLCLLTNVFLLHACLVIEWSRSEADLRHAHSTYRGRSRTPDPGRSRRRPPSPGYMDLPSPSSYRRTNYHSDFTPRPCYDWDGRFACSYCGHHFDTGSRRGNLLIYVDLEVLWHCLHGDWFPGTSGGDVVCMLSLYTYINQDSPSTLTSSVSLFKSLFFCLNLSRSSSLQHWRALLIVKIKKSADTFHSDWMKKNKYF